MTVDFGPEQTQALDRLAGELDASKAAVLRYGLTLLAVALRESKRGRQLGVVEGDRVVRELVGVWSDRIEALA